MSAIITAPQLKLTYFDKPGRGELTRLLLTFGDVAFVDERVSRAEFEALQPTLPLGLLPVAHVNGDEGTTYAQSMAIARYAAKISGLYPQDPVLALQADMVSETLSELLNAYVVILSGGGDDAVKTEKISKLASESIPKALKALDTMVKGKFFLGDDDCSASIADVQLFDFVEYLLKARFPQVVTAEFRNLERVLASVRANKHIAAYLQSQKK